MNTLFDTLIGKDAQTLINEQAKVRTDIERLDKLVLEIENTRKALKAVDHFYDVARTTQEQLKAIPTNVKFEEMFDENSVTIGGKFDATQADEVKKFFRKIGIPITDGMNMVPMTEDQFEQFKKKFLTD